MKTEDIHIDTWADEDEPHQLTKIKLVMTPEEEDKNAVLLEIVMQCSRIESMYATKEESDVDVALNLQRITKSVSNAISDYSSHD